MARTMMLALFAIVAGLAAGCGSSPPVQFYTLSAEASAGADRASTPSLRIAVGAVSLPDVVDRPQIVVRSGPNQVTLVDEHRWAESLKAEIPRVIAEDLGRLLSTGQVWAYPQHAPGAVDYRVLVDVQRFESTPGQAASIDALWTIQRQTPQGVETKTGRSTVQQPVAGQGYDALAAAHSRALAAIANEIADAIRSFAAASR